MCSNQEKNFIYLFIYLFIYFFFCETYRVVDLVDAQEGVVK